MSSIIAAPSGTIDIRGRLHAVISRSIAGALGLDAGDPRLQLYLYTQGSRGCEIVAHPFRGHLGRMLSIEMIYRRDTEEGSPALATLDDLGINILEMTCQGIGNGLVCQQLLVELTPTSVLWSRAGGAVPVWPACRDLYANLGSRLNIDDERQRLVFEALLLGGGPRVYFDAADGSRRPSISIRSFTRRSGHDHQRQVRPRLASAAMAEEFDLEVGSVLIPLPRDLADLVRRSTGQEAEIRFVASADLRTCGLRLWIPTENVANGLSQVCVRGADEHGMSLAVERLLSSAGFVPGPHQLSHEARRSNSWSIWEGAVNLQPGAPPLPTDPEHRWVEIARRLRASLSNDLAAHRRAAELDLTMTRPRLRPALRPSTYRRVTAIQLTTPDVDGGKMGLRAVPPPGPFGGRGRARLRSVAAIGSPSDELQALLSSVAKSRDQVRIFSDVWAAAQHDRPTVFLSYPAGARALADVVKADPILREVFTFLDYQSPHADEDKGDAAIAYIRRSDHFLCIWEPDDHADPRSISTWSGFEFGVARALGRKPIHHLVHKLCDRDYIARRIDSNYVSLKYGDVDTFRRTEMPKLVNRLLRDWTSPPRWGAA
jgi:hypothetical protein